MKKLIILALAATMFAACGRKVKEGEDGFAWNKATVYFVLVDRFCNGDSTNDQQYGRCTDYGSERMNASTFHGGDYAGLLQKAKEGYFTDLGVDVVWLTDPYEQVHGWVPGSGWVVNDFPHYGYHGYYPLDYTQMDKNFGTIEEYRALIDELHAQGIRVMEGANINDIGYPTYLDALQQGFATVPGIDTETAAVEHRRDINYGAWLEAMYDQPDWYTTEWLRRPAETDDPYQMTLYGLPDYLTEKTEPVRLPAFLHRKWQREGNDNDAWTWPAMKALRKDTTLAPDDYVIRYIAAWVEEFGIDGFRCDVVGYVHPWRWKQLHDACNEALNRWRAKHPEQAASKWTDEVMFTGDYDDAYITHLPEYEANGFNSMVNMMFPKDGDLTTIAQTWQAYSDSMAVWQAAGYAWYPFSYLNNAYFREADMEHMDRCATCFLLSPGAVQIFYGDEVGRKTSDAILNVDAAQGFRSDYDWSAPNDTLMAHYRKLCAFRKAHPAVGAGKQTMLNSTTVLRALGKDTIVIALNPHPAMPIPVPFADGDRVKNAYSGETTVVQNGQVMLQQSCGHVALIEKMN